MTTITRTTITAIRADVEAALKTIYAKHGIDVSVGRIMFNADSFRCKIEGFVRGAGCSSTNVPADPFVVALAKKAYLLGNTFKPTDTYQSPSLGKVQVVGYNSKAKKYPVIVKVVSNGKKYKITTLAAKNFVAAGSVDSVVKV